VSVLSTAGKVAKYAAMPGIIPRIKAFFSAGFGQLAFAMAHVYFTVRLLPAGHAYLRPENIGRYGLRHVIGEAANHLVLSRNNLDQILIFFTLLAGIVILALQFFLVFFLFILKPALALPIGTIFATQNATYDIAFVFLDLVFGVPGVFVDPAGVGTCVAQGIDCNPGAGVSILAPAGIPTPFHTALHGLFRFYSMGLTLVAALIFLYFVVVVVAETAMTGTPFGQRFQNIWVPIRLVLALGLMLPLANGINSAQYILLYAAKWGSSLATNGWNAYNDAVAADLGGIPVEDANPVGEQGSLVARPNQTDLDHIGDFMVLVHACAMSHWLGAPVSGPNSDRDGWGFRGTDRVDGHNIYYDPYATTPAGPLGGPGRMGAYLVKNPMPGIGDQREAAYLTNDAIGGPIDGLQPIVTYEEALDFYNNGDIHIVFGIHDPTNEAFGKYPGHVQPTCGKIKIPINSLENRGQGRPTEDRVWMDPPLGVGQGGADALQEFYYMLVRDSYYSVGNPNIVLTAQLGQWFIVNNLEIRDNDGWLLQCRVGCGVAGFPACGNGAAAPCAQAQTPNREIISTYVAWYQGLMRTELDRVLADTRTRVAADSVSRDLTQYGWGGAGMWFTELARLNGDLVTAIQAVPEITHYPLIMERVKALKLKTDTNPGDKNIFNPNRADGSAFTDQDLQYDHGMAAVAYAQRMSSLFLFLHEEASTGINPQKTQTGNIFKDIMNIMFGTNGLFSMRGENAAAHPLAYLTALGKGLVDSAVRNVAVGSFGAAMGGPMRLLWNVSGDYLTAAGNLLISTSFIGITAGVLLYYILPILPFLYFFFAMSAWVKGIFEGMVGVPLWALAHLRIDGEGLPGDAAANGYFLIFEAFLRPILIIFGLVASFIIFSAQVRVLNTIWGLVIDNLTGFSNVDNNNPVIGVNTIVLTRGIVDQFFFTVVYAIIVYLMATASFKLIDTIPNKIMRWSGAGVKSFSEMQEQMAEQISQKVVTSGIIYGRQVTDQIGKVAGTGGQAIAGLGNALRGVGGR